MMYYVISTELDGNTGLSDPDVMIADDMTEARDEMITWLQSHRYGMDREQYDCALERLIAWEGEEIKISHDDGPYIKCVSSR